MVIKGQTLPQRVFYAGYSILIGSFHGRISGTGIRSDLTDGSDGDVRRQECVHSFDQLTGIKRLLDVGVKELLAAVDAGIRPSAPHNDQGFVPKKLTEHVFNHSLNAEGIVLRLPAVVALSMVCDLKEVPHQQRS
jgi:hypothetical protein